MLQHALTTWGLRYVLFLCAQMHYIFYPTIITVHKIEDVVTNDEIETFVIIIIDLHCRSLMDLLKRDTFCFGVALNSPYIDRLRLCI